MGLLAEVTTTIRHTKIVIKEVRMQEYGGRELPASPVAGRRGGRHAD